MTADRDDDELEPVRPARRRADRLGDLLPSTTRDETVEGWGDRDDVDSDDRLQREVPPHHGG